MAYRQFASQVHREIKDLIGKFNIVKAFQTTKIQSGLERILDKYTKLYIDQSESGSMRSGSDQASEYSRVSSIGFEKTQKAYDSP